MYIIKNAFRNIVRSKGRNILIGIIVFVIAVSLCIGLSIRQTASNARENALDGLSVTAQISVDRSKMMQDAGAKGAQNSDNGQKQQFDKKEFKGFSDSLTVDEMSTYASASTVDNFYYTITTSLNATGDLSAVSQSGLPETSSTESSTTETQPSSNQQGFESKDGGFGGRSEAQPDMGGGKMGHNMQNGDFSLTGYSDDSAMTDFSDGTSTITEGSVFAEGCSDYDCIISEELATYNSLSVGDTITLSNPNNDDETYELNICGIYKSSESTNGNGLDMMFSFSDPSNKIYMSYNALKSIVDKSESLADKSEEDTQAVFSQTNGTYVFKTVEDYDTFCEEVYTLGLDENYTVSSTDISMYEQSLVPLETLSTIAGYFLIVIVLIGTLILIILNIFSIRERKYEIGVLTAIGMKKIKVATQFVTEMLIVTIIAVIIGGTVGAISSVPVANALLESQVSSQQQTMNDRNTAFGRNMGGGMQEAPNMQNQAPNENPNDTKIDNSNDGAMGFMSNYISEINSTVDVIVLLQLLGICILIAFIASAVSVLTIMRYDPVKILSERD